MNFELVMMNGDSGLSPVTEPYEEQSPLPSEASLPSTISVPYMDARQDASQYVDQEQIFRLVQQMRRRELLMMNALGLNEMEFERMFNIEEERVFPPPPPLFVPPQVPQFPLFTGPVQQNQMRTSGALYPPMFAAAAVQPSRAEPRSQVGMQQQPPQQQQQPAAEAQTTPPPPKSSAEEATSSTTEKFRPLDEISKLDLSGDSHRKWREWTTEVANVINATAGGSAGWWSKIIDEVIDNHKKYVLLKTVDKAKVVLTKEWQKDKKCVELEAFVRNRILKAMPDKVMARLKPKPNFDAADACFQAAILAGPGTKSEKKKLTTAVGLITKAKDAETLIESLNSWKESLAQAALLGVLCPLPADQVDLITDAVAEVWLERGARLRIDLYVEENLRDEPEEQDVQDFINYVISELMEAPGKKKGAKEPGLAL